MKKQLAGAQKDFDKQMEQDGWAGDLADGISILWGSDNRASKVRKDITAYNKDITELEKAAQKGDAYFNAKFKQISDQDFDQNAIADYFKNPTQKNFEKALGRIKNIKGRVATYRESKQTGAAVVKTSAKVAAGIAVGVATGGTGLVALGVAAAGTAAASVAIEETDRMNLTKAVTEGKVEFREGTDHGQILKDAAWDGASVLAGGAVAKATGTVIKGATKAAAVTRAATNTAGDVAMGAAQEYAQTGEVSASGTIMNAALGSVGIAAETGALKKVKNLITGKNSPAPDVSATVNPQIETSAPAPKESAVKTSQVSENFTPEVKTSAQTIQNEPSAGTTTQTRTAVPDTNNAAATAKSADNSGIHEEASAQPSQVKQEPAAPPLSTPETTAGIQFSEAEQKAFTRLKNSEATQEVINNIAERIKNGETPTIDMKKAAIKEVAEKHGVRQMELNIETGMALGDLSKADASWKSLNDAIQTDSPNSEILKGIETFKQNKGLTASVSETTTGIQFSEAEQKAFARIKNSDAAQEVLNNIAERIKNGETPNIDMKKAAIKEVAEKHGVRQMELNIETGMALGDLSKADASWKSLNDAIQTDSPGPEKLKDLETFKQNKGLTSAQTASLETAGTSSAAGKLAQFRGTSLDVPPNGTTSLEGIMSNRTNMENYLKNADLTNENVRQSFTDMLEADFPGFKSNPKNQKTLEQMQQLLNHPEYNNLSDTNKTIAKLSVLKDSGIDPAALQSKYKVSTSIKRRIEDIDYCLQGNQSGAAALYHKGDYDTFKVLNDVKTSTKADIAATDAIRQKADTNGHIMLQQSHIINNNKIPEQQISKNGNNYNVKVLDLTDEKVLANLEQYGFGSGTTADNLRLTVHMNDDFNKAPQQSLGRMRNSSELNLSATLTDGANHLYGDMQYGVILDYDQGALSYASNYAAGTGFTKNRSSFAADKLGESASSADHFIRDRFIENMKKNGTEITTDDYAAITTMFKDRKMTNEQMNRMFPDGTITVNGKKFNTSDVQTALEQSSNDLLTMRAEIMGGHFKEGFNELNIYNPEIKAIYIRDNGADGTIQELVSEKLLKYAQDNNIPIVFQRNNITT